MRHSRLLLLLFGLLCAAAPTLCRGATDGLNTIPTTDTLNPRRYTIELQNGNASLQTPTFSTLPEIELGSEYGFTHHIEAGIDYITAEDGSRQWTGDIKNRFHDETLGTPGAAVGITDLGNRQRGSAYIALSKTLNLAQELKRAKYNAQNAGRTHKDLPTVNGRRVHAGLLQNENGGLEPFLGTDLQLNQNVTVEADWISGTGNAITLGVEYLFPNQRLAVQPVFLYSNDTHRVDGFFLNISEEFILRAHPTRPGVPGQ